MISKLLLVLFSFATCNAFVVPSSSSARLDETSLAATVGRRTFLDAATAAALVFVPARNAFASGGATAGGPYLISAKQRYNDRIKSSMKAYLALGKSLESGSTEETKAYFMSEDIAGWKDGSAAGYLLANAFRRNSTASPDSLPAVKKWKAFAAEVEKVMKLTKKKDTSKIVAAYGDSLAALDEYLAEVELPASKEL